MAKMIYSMLTSLDGYTEDEHGQFGWALPKMHQFTRTSTNSDRHLAPTSTDGGCTRPWSSGETAHTLPDQSPFVLDYARQWQAAEKIVFARNLAEPRSTRTRIVRTFDSDEVRRLKADAERDLTVDGPGLAMQLLCQSCRRTSNDRLPRGRRGRNTVFPGWRAAGVGVGRGAAVPQRCARSAIRRPRDLKARFRVP